MKILYKNKITAVTSPTGGPLGTYVEANTQDADPDKLFIGDASTIQLSCACDPKVTALFVGRLNADTASYTLKDNLGATVETGNLNTKIYANQRKQLLGEYEYRENTWQTFGTNQSKSSTVVIDLTSATDVKGRYGITNWDQSSGATGNFTDGSSNVSVLDNPDIKVGAFITISSTEYQITKIVGDGTTAGDITLSGSVADNTIDSIKRRISVGIIQAGSSVEFPTAQAGLTRNKIGFKRIAQGNIITDRDHVLELMDIAHEKTRKRRKRPEPFPMLLVSKLGANFDFAMFARFQTFPVESMLNSSLLASVNFIAEEL